MKVVVYMEIGNLCIGGMVVGWVLLYGFIFFIVIVFFCFRNRFGGYVLLVLVVEFKVVVVYYNVSRRRS